MMKTEWNGDYVSPYAEHGKKSEQVKKITVSIPLKASWPKMQACAASTDNCFSSLKAKPFFIRAFKHCTGDKLPSHLIQIYLL